MVLVKEGLLRKTSESISVITNPLQGVYSSYKLLDILFD